MSNLDFTLLMPCLNEIKTLPEVVNSAKKTLAYFDKMGVKGEILISDNLSTDGSQDFAKQVGCRVISCLEHGYGSAIKFGSEHALGSIIVMGDSDATYDFEESIPMIHLLLSGFDICMGTRLKGRILPGSMPFKNRWLGVPVLTILLNICFQTGFTDAHCGLRAYTKDSFLKMDLQTTGMELASEMLIRAKQLKLKSIEIPITLHPSPKNRQPHLRPWRDGLRHVKLILRMWVKSLVNHKK